NENISGNIKAGGKMHHLSRETDKNGNFARLAEVQWNQGARDFLLENDINPDAALRLEDFRDPDYLEERGQYFLGGNHEMVTVVDRGLMDTYIQLASPAWYPVFADTWKDDYNGTEELAAAYLMTELSFGTKWMLLGGVRYESLQTDYHANFTVQTQTETGYNLDTLNHAVRIHGHWFPNFQLRYKASDWFDVRFAYSKTISRPDFSYFAPKKFIFEAKYGYTGNANLQPAISQNLDLYTSFHHKYIGLFTAGGFYKRMSDVFYPAARLAENLPEEVGWPEQGESGIPRTEVSAQISTFMNNPYPAIVKGIELDWQTNFWYLPKPLNALVFNINYTRAFSEMDYQESRLYEYLEPNPIPGRPPIKRFAEVDTFRTARLLHQGDHIINIVLGVDIGGFAGRISFRMQDDVITAVGNRPEEDQFSEKYMSWDLSLKQRLPLKGLSLFFNAVNLFHASENSYRLFGPDFETHNNAYKSYNPRLFQFGIRYEL
ncbi:MAG: TonB-dependent receptor, partial [Bacteroidota bacterium]